jgi:RES domain
VPRFVMDAAKLAGFEGIRYRSVRAMDGENLVLFRRDWPAECVGEPRQHVEEEARDFDVVR